MKQSRKLGQSAAKRLNAASSPVSVENRAAGAPVKPPEGAAASQPIDPDLLPDWFVQQQRQQEQERKERQRQKKIEDMLAKQKEEQEKRKREEELRRQEQERQEQEYREKIGEPRHHPSFVRVKIYSIEGTGSDVDEIYGSITTTLYDTNSWPALPDDAPLDLGHKTIWTAGNGKIDLSKGRVMFHQSPIVFQARSTWEGGQHITVELSFALYDEDGERDYGSGYNKDERFRIIRANRKADDFSVILPCPEPAYAEQPEYLRTQRQAVSLQSNGNNFITVKYGMQYGRTIWSSVPDL